MRELAFLHDQRFPGGHGRFGVRLIMGGRGRRGLAIPGGAAARPAQPGAVPVLGVIHHPGGREAYGDQDQAKRDRPYDTKRQPPGGAQNTHGHQSGRQAPAMSRVR